MECRNQRGVLAGQKQINIDDFGVERLQSASDVDGILDRDLPFYSGGEPVGRAGRRSRVLGSGSRGHGFADDRRSDGGTGGVYLAGTRGGWKIGAVESGGGRAGGSGVGWRMRVDVPGAAQAEGEEQHSCLDKGRHPDTDEKKGRR